MKKNYFKFCPKSFGLIEVLISVAIIAMFLGALIGLTASGTKSTLSSENRLQAANLAREGMEMVRQIRDTAYLNGANWRGGASNDLDGVCWGLASGTNNGRRLVYSSPPSACSFNHPYLASGSENITGYKIPFRRQIIIDDIPPVPSNLKKITVIITWAESGVSKNIQMISYLSNWQ
jgi:type II secretory pathway pseudopilin PulG